MGGAHSTSEPRGPKIVSAALLIKIPFSLKENSCKAENYSVGASIDSFMKVAPNNAKALMKAIAMYGPATASINTEAKTLKFYKHGIYDDKLCSEYSFLSCSQMLLTFPSQQAEFTPATPHKGSFLLSYLWLAMSGTKG